MREPTAAALEIGREALHVSLAGGPPKVFATPTGPRHARRDWRRENGVRTVALEATGSSWRCPDAVREKAGLEGVMVHGPSGKNLPGRNPDLQDCQGQSTLHAHGRWRPGLVPPEHLRRCAG